MGTENETNVTNTSNTLDTTETKKAEAPLESIKTMKKNYLEKKIEKDNQKVNSIGYFIDSYKDGDFVEIDGVADPSGVNSIAKSAFAHSDVKKILFKGCYKEIGEKAFEGCEELDTVIFGELGKDEVIKNATLKNLTIAPTDNNYTIQVNAFKGCGKLTTLVLPSPKDGNSKLVIEKDAFFGCGALRTVVAIYGEIDVTGNPFADSPEHLTFVCKKDSGVARFARENGYRSVYVD